MSALDNLLDEVRLEAKLAVQTEYENTVAEQRNQILELTTTLDTITKDRDKWREYGQNMAEEYDILVSDIRKRLGRK